MAYFSSDRLMSFFLLFGIEAPLACAFMYWLSGVVDATCPASDTARMTWILQRLFLTVVPSFSYLWGAMRAFDADTKAEDPFAGVETKRWQTFQKILTNNTEQVIIFVPIIISLAMVCPCESWAAVPTFLYSFVIGRALFGAGYFIPAFQSPFAPWFTLYGWARSPGMNLTLYPANFALCMAAYYLSAAGECDVPDAPAKKFLGIF